jgi:hypothetical protein
MVVSGTVIGVDLLCAFGGELALRVELECVEWTEREEEELDLLAIFGPKLCSMRPSWSTNTETLMIKRIRVEEEEVF